MGQQEVYNLLKKHRKKWLSTREIVNKLKVSSGSAMNSLQKLRKRKSVIFKLEKKIANRKVYVYRFRK